MIQNNLTTFSLNVMDNSFWPFFTVCKTKIIKMWDFKVM